MSHSRVQVTWPRGYTARRSGGKVEVLNRYGEVVARTGPEVHLVGGYEKPQLLGVQPGAHPMIGRLQPPQRIFERAGQLPGRRVGPTGPASLRPPGTRLGEDARARAGRQRFAAVLLTIAVALLLAGCGGQPVLLLTGWGALGPPENDMVGCYTNFAVGELVVDAEFGTALIEDGREAVPVMWPPGTTGRRAGSDVEVVNKKGEVIARTGNRYQIEGAGSARYPLPGWLACGYVLPK